MRKFSLVILLLANILLAKPQIGINMANPRGVVSISAKNDALLNNDLVIKINSTGEANVILGGNDSPDNTSLALNETNKGLLLNRVSLESTNDVQTVPNPLDGMLVYNNNTSNPSEISNLFSIEPGVYFNQDKHWRRLYTVVGGTGEDVVAYIRDLGTTSTSSSAVGSGNYYQPTTAITNIETGAGAATLFTRVPTTNNSIKGDSSFEVPESGNFVFIFRWYGHPYSRSSSIITDYNYYAYLFKSGDSTPLTYTLVKPWLTSNFSTSFSIMATPYLNKGDKIEIRIGQENSATAAQWRLISHEKNLANRTSFVYFKYI